MNPNESTDQPTVRARRSTVRASRIDERPSGMRRKEVPELSFFGAATRCHASNLAMEVTANAVQVLGGYGYLKECPVE